MFHLGVESSEEKVGLIDDLLFEKVDSGRAEEGATHDESIDKRLKKLKAEFKAVTGKEVKDFTIFYHFEHFMGKKKQFLGPTFFFEWKFSGLF